MKSDKELRLISVLESVASDNGFELIDVELSGSANNRLVRVYLDKEGGIGIEDITEANRWVDPIVEEHEPFSGSFNLEVSSPGIDRPLRTLEHFMRYIGEEARITTVNIDGRAHWSGVLEAIEGTDVIMGIEGQSYRLPYEKIKKAHLKARIDFNKKGVE